MRLILSIHDGLFEILDRLFGAWLLPTLARFAFAATLLVYYWNSALTKTADGTVSTILSPSLGAYVQIFPRQMEAVGYDVSQFGTFHYTVIVFATIAELVLPALLVLGLCTRLAALGMIGFIIVQTLTDLFGHGAIEHAETLGAWFDGMPDGLILDQRLMWIILLLLLVLKGAGPLSVDRIFKSS